MEIGPSQILTQVTNCIILLKGMLELVKTCSVHTSQTQRGGEGRQTRFFF